MIAAFIAAACLASLLLGVITGAFLAGQRERAFREQDRAELLGLVRELLTRLQAWDPQEPAPEPPKTPQAAQSQDLDDGEQYTIDRLHEMGLEPAGEDGEVVDRATRIVFESTGEYLAWKKYCRANNLSETTDPRVHFAQKNS